MMTSHASCCLLSQIKFLCSPCFSFSFRAQIVAVAMMMGTYHLVEASPDQNENESEKEEPDEENVGLAEESKVPSTCRSLREHASPLRVVVGMLFVATCVLLMAVLPVESPMASEDADNFDNEVMLDGVNGPGRPWSRHEFPCYQYEKHQHERGMFYVKVPKTASSTLAGVGLRIAHRNGHLLNDTKEAICNVEVKHGSVRNELLYGQRDKEKSFLWSFVRDPTSHAISFFFYAYVSRNGHKPSDKNFRKWVKDKVGHYQIDYLKLRKNHKPLDAVVKDTLREYDFIGVTERMDESLVVLQMLLGLNVGDILHLSAKTSGGYAYVSNNGLGPRCVKEETKFVSEKMKDFFDSDEWHEHIQEDTLLYRAANHSLDLTIDALGRKDFESKLNSYRIAQSIARQKCEEKTIFPCLDGQLHKANDCYQMDQGCGYACLDEVAQDLTNLV